MPAECRNSNKYVDSEQPKYCVQIYSKETDGLRMEQKLLPNK